MVNKVGFLVGVLTLPFVAYMYLPVGRASLPLFLFDDAGRYIGIFGIVTIGPLVPLVQWWFVTSSTVQLLAGAAIWLFPVLSCLLSFLGVRKPPEAGRKIYSASFVLLLIPLILLVIDALFFGSIVLHAKYGLGEFIAATGTGFWVYVFDMALAIAAAAGYREV